jgi:ribosomal protein L11 methyltransferase
VWFQLQIANCTSEMVEVLSDCLEEAGAVSITLTDKNDLPVLEPLPGTTPLWPEVVIQALFSSAIEANLAHNQMLQDYPSLQSQVEMLVDQDWERVCMADFKPQRFGERLWICPTWLTPPEPKAVNLMLDPGLACGTGTHPTTALCLAWLDSAELNNKSLIDYGCGSGILALAALKLGAATVFAVDIDDQALIATQNNAQTNHLDNAKLRIGKPDDLHKPVDCILANILLGPLLALAERFHQLLNPGAVLVVSGILEAQAPILIEAYRDRFHLIQQERLEGWCLLRLQAHAVTYKP